MAVTRGCVITIIKGVPVGAHIAWLLCTTSGWPLESTRTLPISQFAVTQGPLATVGGGKVQPAIRYGPAMVTVGWPLTMTRGLGMVGVAWPPWAQIT